MNVLDDAVNRLERWQFLDKIGDPLRKATQFAVKPRMVRNLLSGIPTGHPLHAVLTDIPIGAWTMASLLDLVGGESSQQAADTLVAAGLVTAVPTAASGLNDWSDTFGETSRVGVAHAALNVTALSLYATSFLARKAGRRATGRGLALTGLGVLLASGYLGGHLAYTKGVKVNHTAWHEGPADWQDALAESDLEDGKPKLAKLGDVQVMVVRDRGQILALDNICTHEGGPLNEGKIENGCVTCPWHGSQFRLSDGAAVRGPAAAPEPSYEARVQDGRVQLRARP
ncbi:Rieske 2Fe-2S domain-containing protein [Sinomonas susongensis]|uniref:Rieske 2Fe-2S domain-containing protein n=1 Tax=Sinomonas susongensis TaxID=1324851 RepID=UPI001108DAF6|nr:Rieske 2Fe-2S domain-containing protein [Sinomonas susongensis]